MVVMRVVLVAERVALVMLASELVRLHLARGARQWRARTRRAASARVGRRGGITIGGRLRQLRVETGGGVGRGLRVWRM